jgi:CHAT domain-containing protein
VVGYETTAKKVFDNLQLPSNSKYKNLIVIPDGILNFIPFEALITKSANTSNFAKMHYLLHDFSIGYANSVAFYMNENKESDKKGILGVFPVFENTDLELPFSKKELLSIKENFEGTFFEKKAATFKNFSKNAAHFSVLHLSTHAAAGDIETPASIRFYDREVFYSELYNLNINPDLVVLSACETGLGKWYTAEGAMSVSRGFQMAGAKNLLFSLWKVNDYTTSVMMSKFYKNVSDSKAYFEANHQSKLDFLNDTSISNAKKSPYFWAPMVYYGSVASNSSSGYGLYVCLGVGLLMALFIFLRYKVVR